ncbi:hypothetical protein PLESTB_001112100 [Pleodorina starrii]|uniref:Uncharacterized protein n=1 Tax=Pleodorina starrii TaxID=330485 RepID=A0A9W6BQR3_9CHLO|nr:hypothetical protein PLESTB_001112100 [Pleodorina starrii]
MRSALLASSRSRTVLKKRTPFSPARRTNIIRARGGTPEEPKPARKEDDGPLQTALRLAASTWSGLDTQQRVYAVVAGTALLVAAPQLLTFSLIALERLLVGALLAVEEGLAAGLLLGTRLVGGLGWVVLGV